MKKFRLLTLLGIRPDYIRMHKLIKLLDENKNDLEHILVHSGQHYDSELFKNFLKEFNIRQPDYDLGVGLSLKEKGVSNHAYQVALLNERLYDLLEKIKPDAVMYLGDTNTVLSSVTVARCNIPIIHLEAGGRSFDWRMPEEKNRVIIDHLSDALYSYTNRHKEILISEGIDASRVKTIGNIIVDAIDHSNQKAEESNILNDLKIQEKNFILTTLHREENISTKEILENKLSDILKFAKENKLPVVFPIMPRTQASIEKFGLSHILNNPIFIKTQPLGFFNFLRLEKSAKLVVSDSGTVQEETLILGTPCVIARRSTERPETIWAGATILEGQEGPGTLYNKMIEVCNMSTNWDKNSLNPEGGSPSQRTYEDIVNKIKSGYFKDSRGFDMIKHNPFAREAHDTQ